MSSNFRLFAYMVYLGVADGVGGWTEKGVDPSFFSKYLMESCCRVSERESVELHDPVKVLIRALKEVARFHSKCYGGFHTIHFRKGGMFLRIRTCN